MKKTVFAILVIFAAVMFTGCREQAPQISPELSLQMTLADAQKEEYRARIVDTDRLRALQIKVFENCVERKGTPVLQNGNVGCIPARP